MLAMDNSRKNWNPNRDPKEAWDYDPPDPSSLEVFTGPFDSTHYKDGRKLSDEERFIRIMAYLAQYGSEVRSKTEWNCDDYWTSDPNAPSFTTAARKPGTPPRGTPE